jgi:hypothetical protein
MFSVNLEGEREDEGRDIEGLKRDMIFFDMAVSKNVSD